MIDVLLIDPPVSSSTRFGKLAKAGSFLPSLALVSLAAVAREAGFSVKIIDSNLSDRMLKDLVREIINEKPRFIGLTATTLTIDTVGELTKLIKRKKPEIITIVGGAHVTAIPKGTLRKYPTIDIGVLGEGEQTFRELLMALSAKSNLSNIEGLSYRRGDKIYQNQLRPSLKNLDLLPLPAWDLLTGFPNRYRPSVNTFLKLPAVHLVTSRGCTGQCLFCDRSVFGRVPRFYSAEKVLELVDLLIKNYRVKEIQFFDDNFALNPKRLEKICQGLAKRKMSWSCQVRADMVNLKMLRMMKKAGCWQVGIGIESGSDEILKILKKQETTRVLKEAVVKINQAGLEVKGFFILGNPGETKETLKETEEFILSLPLTYAHTTYFTPYPGSEAYKQIAKYGILNETDNWSRIGRGTIDSVFVPFDINQSDLVTTASRIFRRFYFRPKIMVYYFKKVIKTPRLWPAYLKGFMSVLSFANNNEKRRTTAN